MFSKRQIIAPVLLILLLAWAAGGPTRQPSFPRDETVPSSSAAPSPATGGAAEELPMSLDLAGNGWRDYGAPALVNLFLHAQHESESGLALCGVCRIDISFLDPFPDLEGAADYSPPSGQLGVSGVVLSLALPSFGKHFNGQGGQGTPFTGGVVMPVPEPGSGWLAMVGLVALTVAGCGCAPRPQERHPSRVRRSDLRHARAERLIAS